MEVEVVKTLISAFKEADLTKLNLKCDDFELQLEKELTVKYTPEAAPVMQAPVTAPAQNNQIAAAEAPKEKAEKVIAAPMVGTFYNAEGPGAKPFVEVGTKVKKGDVVCIIEAMKLMNEVESEVDGEVVEILIGNEEMVEYGQPLFVLK